MNVGELRDIYYGGLYRGVFNSIIYVLRVRNWRRGTSPSVFLRDWMEGPFIQYLRSESSSGKDMRLWFFLDLSRPIKEESNNGDPVWVNKRLVCKRIERHFYLKRSVHATEYRH